MFGGGGMNPRKMKQMMEQMGIDVEELDVEEVLIRTADGDLVFDDAQVTRMDAQGQQTYQVVGEPTERESEPTEASGGADASSDDGNPAVEESDVELVAQRTGASEERARETLAETDGDLAAAVASLESE